METVFMGGPARIRHLWISSLRGIPQHLGLDFQVQSGGPPRSLILIGENASGKSSIGDAIDWVLRGFIGQERAWIDSFACAGRAGAIVTLEDGSSARRGDVGTPPAGSLDLTGRRVHPRFSLGPVVVRRRDIVGFWSTPAPQRRSLSTRYLFRPETLPAVPSRESIASARAAREGAEARWSTTVSSVKSLEIGIWPQMDRESIDEAIESFAKGRRWVRDALTAHRDRPHRWPSLSAPRHQLGLDLSLEELLVVGLDDEAHRVPPRSMPRTAAARRDRRQRVEFDALLAARDELYRAREADDEVRRRVELCGDWIGLRDRLLDEVLRRLNSLLQTSFLEIAHLPHLNDIRAISTDDEHLDLEITIAGTRRVVSPTAILSEASLDLLALFYVCAIAEAAAELGQAQVLVLDDVFQSVDAAYRLRAAEFLVKRFADWQLIILTHDRLWAAELAKILQAAQGSAIVRKIASWSFEEGPVVLAGDLDPTRRITDALTVVDRDPARIAWASGLALEEICNELSWRLEVSLSRRRDDRYTLGDLWPPVASRLKKLGLEESVEPVTRHLELRNVLGSHFNEWAQGASLAEAEGFAAAVLTFKDRVTCQRCASYLRKAAARAAVCDKGCLYVSPLAGGPARP